MRWSLVPRAGTPIHSAVAGRRDNGRVACVERRNGSVDEVDASYFVTLTDFGFTHTNFPWVWIGVPDS